MASSRCDKCIKARPGQRVVRGPYWWGGDEDGGSDYVGTVVSVCQPEKNSGYTTHPVQVLWDAGICGHYRAGCSSATGDLRLIDAGPSGVTFANITCAFCETKHLAGTRWKCAKCVDYNLCHSCYMGDKHNIEHEFLRYDDPDNEGFPVPARQESKKFQFYGIFPGAEVQCRSGYKMGLVANVRGEARLLRKTAAGKLCYSNTDKVDGSLKFKKAACGGFYYRDHMPIIALPGHDPWDIELFRINQKTVSTGGYVTVIHNQEQLKSLLNARLGTRYERQEWCCGKDGHVVSVIGSTLLVRCGKREDTFDPECLIPKRTTFCAKRSNITSGGKGLGYGLYKGSLSSACNSGKEDVVRMLLMIGADLEEADENGDRAVHHASGREDSVILGLLVSAGAKTGACNKFNETALHVAIKENCVDCARVLAKNIKDSDINIQDNAGDTVLHSALKAGMHDIIHLLLQRTTVNVAIKDDEGETALHLAVERENLWVTKQILQKSRDIADEQNKKKMTALHIAVSKNLFEIAKALLTQGRCNPDIQYCSDLKTPLAAAVAHGYIDIVELLVESGADVNKSDREGNTPLHLCVTYTECLIPPSPSRAPKMSLMVKKLQEVRLPGQPNGLALAGLLASRGGDLQKENKKGLKPPQLCDSTTLVRLLLVWNTQESARGRYREQLSDLLNTKDKNGMNHLQREAYNGRQYILELLLAQDLVGINSVCGEKLKTALSLAAAGGRSNHVNILLKASADVNKADADGNTPLHTSVMKGFCDVVELLVKAGADVNKQDANGNTPLHISVMKGFCDVVELLVEAGADVNKQDANGNTPLHISLMTRREENEWQIDHAQAPKMKAIVTELKNVNHGEINTSHALACFLISSGSSMNLKNAQGLNPLNIVDSMPAIRMLLKWASERREPPAEEESFVRSAEGSTSFAERCASSAENTGGPIPSDQQAHCISVKKEPKQE